MRDIVPLDGANGNGSRPTTMSTAKKTFLLRLDPKVYESLQRWADAELRSVNGQIEFVLKQAVAKQFGKVVDAGGSSGEAGSPTGGAESNGTSAAGPRRE
jgi:hypothetical protein